MDTNYNLTCKTVVSGLKISNFICFQNRIVAMIVALATILLFFFVPETFWDRTPTRKSSSRPNFLRRLSSRYTGHKAPTPHGPPMSDSGRSPSPGAVDRHTDLHVGFTSDSMRPSIDIVPGTPSSTHHKHLHVGFADASALERQGGSDAGGATTERLATLPEKESSSDSNEEQDDERPRSVHSHVSSPISPNAQKHSAQNLEAALDQKPPGSSSNSDYFSRTPDFAAAEISESNFKGQPKIRAYTHNLRQLPAQSFTQQLKLYHGRLNADNWFKVSLRPFVLFAYPAVLWSSIIYACSIGWLIVISETMAIIYRNPQAYNFSALQTGLVYVSPFIGGILGTGVAGKISDIIVKAMARRNGGLYEPEFRLVMAIPILITTCIGLMGFGWSAEEKDHWIVPTVFFGLVSFGCSLGSTTSITFCVDSYRQYAGEALVTLNFSKNVLHGLVFSLFVTHWLADDGPKMVFIWIGVIQLILVLLTIPMYIYGKRLRMWTVRKNLMEKL